MPHVAVVIGGGEIPADAVAALPDDTVVIAADSGLDHAVAAGLAPSMLVGDLDSISAAGRMWAYAHQVSIEEHSPHKDLTDTELAIVRATEVVGISGLTVLGGLGDRLDHLLGTLLALGHPSLAGLPEVLARFGHVRVVVLHPGRSVLLDVEPGTTFSLLALHGPASGIGVRGAEWELVDADLSPTEARGVSNQAKEKPMISVTSGIVTVMVS